MMSRWFVVLALFIVSCSGDQESEQPPTDVDESLDAERSDSHVERDLVTVDLTVQDDVRLSDQPLDDLVGVDTTVPLTEAGDGTAPCINKYYGQQCSAHEGGCYLGDYKLGECTTDVDCCPRIAESSMVLDRCVGGICVPPGTACNDHSDCAEHEDGSVWTSLCVSGRCMLGAPDGSPCLVDQPGLKGAPHPGCEHGTCLCRNPDYSSACYVQVSSAGNGCSSDIECDFPEAYCSSNRCVGISGTCGVVECDGAGIDADDCGPGVLCISGRCVACANDRDCPSNHTCINGRCGKMPDGTCRQNYECDDGEYCAHDQCVFDSGVSIFPAGHCKPKTVVPGESGLECPDSVQCPLDEHCVDGLCVGKQPSGNYCTGDTDCGDGLLCSGYTCVAPQELGGYCAQTYGSGIYSYLKTACQSGICVRCECASSLAKPGEQCFIDGDCQSGDCVNYTCSTNVVGSCDSDYQCGTSGYCDVEACVQSGYMVRAVGQCKPFIAGGGSGMTCPNTEQCPLTEICVGGVCVAKKQPAGGYCDSSSYCETGLNCYGHVCSASKLPNGAFCLEATSNVSSYSESWCASGKCAKCMCVSDLLGAGKSCYLDDDCASGDCVDYECR